jgi:glutathione reductase (NADPH)
MIGGGYIAAEFSHLAARAGARVTVLQRADRMLTSFDPDVVAWLMESFAGLGIDVHTRTTVQSVEKSGHGFVVNSLRGDKKESLVCDLVVHAAGRAPDLDELDLTAGEVATVSGRLQLNDHLQSTSNGRVYAAGDAAAKGPPLTPVSSHDARVAAANMLEGNRRRPDYRGVPSVAFTVPPIAAVGLSESAAREQSRNLRVRAQDTAGWFTARRMAEPVYGFKVIIDADTDRILGAHLVGPQADEVINLFGLAIRHDLTAAQLRSTMFAYPTGASDIGYML